MWWVFFNLFVLGMLAVDLGIFHRRPQAIKPREALAWTGFWIAVAALFNVGLYFGWVGNYSVSARSQSALEFLAGYLVEKSLSVDNLFVFVLVFSYFRVPASYQHKVLSWGILGALILRGIFIFAGVALLEMFHWVVYLFGAFLLLSGLEMARQKGMRFHPERNLVMRLFRRVAPVTDNYIEDKLFVKRGPRLFVTPLLVALLFIEFTDLIFAADSIPAVLAVTRDPFIVYTSNVLAILGMRALYSALAGVMPLFHYLRYGLAAILVFVGTKMLVSSLLNIPIVVSLAVIVAILAVSVAASIARPVKVPVAAVERGGTGRPT